MENEFVDLIDYEGLYKINRLGEILSIRKNIIMTHKNNCDGYYRICLQKNKTKKMYLLHRLLAIHFIDNPENLTLVDHIDNNRQNNNLLNLRWCDHELNRRNSKNVYESKGSISIKRTTKKGKYYQARYYIDYNTQISKTSYDRHELELWLEQCLVNYPRTERV